MIAGPNASGKSTLLEAVRLIKTVLSPRLINEGQPGLTQIGLLHPHLQAIGSLSYDFAAIANRPNFRTTLALSLALTEVEIDAVKSSIDQLALIQLQSELNGPVDQLSFTQFLSSQPGQVRLQTIRTSTESQVSSLNPSTPLDFELTFNPSKGQISGNNVFNQSVLTILDRRLPPDKTLMSFFPADRAFPQGETPIQVGSADAQAQVQAHMSTPATKYARLKQTIVQNVMLSPQGRETLEREFNLIFDNLLPGKRLAGVSFNALGLLKVLVKEEASGRIFDIDQMSSGEKGLVLTFIFIRLTMEKGGVILLDEPELHLNAAVQAKIVPFLVEHCVKPLSLQAFVCTHSPEIVRDAYHGDLCSLFHIRSSSDLTPILQQDMEPLIEIFSRLGSSTADLLSTRGNVYVEGEHDNAILQSGFADVLTGFQVQGLGGRSEIEKEVPNLQAEEKRGRLKKLQLFILDGDRKPTGLNPSNLVRVRQLKRYCIENYLLNDNVLYDIVHQNASKDAGSRGAFPAKLEQLAFRHIRGGVEISLRYSRTGKRWSTHKRHQS